MSTPEDLICGADDLWPCWAAGGWDEACESSMQLADGRTRGQARHRYMAEVGDWSLWTKLGVWKRWVRPLTRQEAWEDYLDRCLDEFNPGSDEVRGQPAGPVPVDWEPDVHDEGASQWRFVPRGTPGAVAYWVVGDRGDDPPPAPSPRDTDQRQQEGGSDA